MERLTNEAVKADASVDGMIGPFVDLTNMKPKLLDVILNGPTLISVSKNVLRSIIRQLYSVLAAYEDTGLTPEQCENAKVIIESAFSDDTAKAERIRELLKADKEGRIVVLPCKVGDTVYKVITIPAQKPVMLETQIKTLGQAADVSQLIGKKNKVINIFLTREQAEVALEEAE